MLKVEKLIIKFHLHLAVRKIAYHSKPILVIRAQFHSSVFHFICYQLIAFTIGL